jgi:hypothetical protein
VNIKRPTGAEVDDRAGLEFFNFQESISFPQEGYLSDRHEGDLWTFNHAL